MKGLKFFLGFLCLLVSTLFGDVPFQDAYIQVSSVASQIPIPVTGSLITFDNVSLVKNFTVTPTNDGIICKIAGTYIIFSTLQIATFMRGIGGYIDNWFVINGIPMDSSSDRQYVDENARFAQATNGTLVELKEGDVLSAMFVANRSKIGIMFIQSALSSEPSVTSFFLSAYRVK